MIKIGNNYISMEHVARIELRGKDVRIHFANVNAAAIDLSSDDATRFLSIVDHDAIDTDCVQIMTGNERFMYFDVHHAHEG